jgi:hypothetical protein
MIREGVIYFRFKSERDSDTLVFSGDSINVGTLKQLIEEKRTSLAH